MALKVVSMKRCSRNHPLSDEAKERNSVKSTIRACVGTVFGFMATSVGGKLTRKIGLERNKAWSLAFSNYWPTIDLEVFGYWICSSRQEAMTESVEWQYF